MILSGIALRIATVLALRGTTIAGDNVIDSPMLALDSLIDKFAGPVIAVATVESERRGLAARGRVELVIECGLVIQQSDTETAEFGKAATASELVTMVALFERSIINALGAQSEAADLWRTLASPSLGNSSPGLEYSSLPGFTEDQRLAARQILMSVDVLPDPMPGDPIPEWMTRFLALIESDAEFAPIHGMLAAFLTGQGQAEDLRESARLFLPSDTVRALGFGLMARRDDGSAVTLEEISGSGLMAGFDVPADTRI